MRLKSLPAVWMPWEGVWWLVILSVFVIATANRPPRFLIDGQSEIVIRLKESPDTPVGKKFYYYLLLFFFTIKLIIT